MNHKKELLRSLWVNPKPRIHKRTASGLGLLPLVFNATFLAIAALLIWSYVAARRLGSPSKSVFFFRLSEGLEGFRGLGFGV